MKLSFRNPVRKISGIKHFSAPRHFSGIKPTSKLISKPSLSVKSSFLVKPFQPRLSIRRFSGNPFSGVGRLNHVAIAVPNLSASSKMYKDVMGAKVSSPVDLPEHGVTTVFVELENTKIELLHPLGQNSPIQGFLDKKPSGGIHHICLEVDDINVALNQMKQKNVKVIDEKPKIGAHGKPVVFLHPKGLDGVLLELEQK